LPFQQLGTAILPMINKHLLNEVDNITICSTTPYQKLVVEPGALKL
jgi:hypothetical protein